MAKSCVRSCSVVALRSSQVAALNLTTERYRSIRSQARRTPMPSIALSISQTALNDKKREVFETLAATYRKLAGDIEAVIVANVVLDEERDKRLIGLLGKDGDHADNIDETAKPLGRPKNPKPPGK